LLRMDRSDMELSRGRYNEQHRAALQDLNRNYIHSVDEADVAWFDANLAAISSTPTPTAPSSSARPFLPRSVAAHPSRISASTM
jgi:hypothetical protein